MNIPTYPDDFYKLDRIEGFDAEKQINKEIKNMIKYMEENKLDNYSVSFQDILIIVDRVNEDGDLYEISVSQKHTRGFVRV